MEHITGIPREQITLFPDSVDDYIHQENPVRFLDAFVDQLDTGSLGFVHAKLPDTGRPPYNPKDMLKLYLYGYLNRVRSSRLLERESARNLEVLWLLKRLSPDHKTISDFRRNNVDALRLVFKEFVALCKKLQLFGNELVAIDSTKFKAQNARDRVKDRKQVNDTLGRINESIAQYLQELDENDTTDDATSTPLTKNDLKQKIASLQNRQQELEKANDELQTSGDKYISLTDTDCRLIKDRHGIEPSYRMQTAVDDKYSLIVDYEVTNDAVDNNHLSTMSSAAKTALNAEHLTVCADAGYYDTIDLKTCEDDKITTYVPVPRQKVPKRTHVPTPEYYHDQFLYDSTSDTFQCPAGESLKRSYPHPTSDGRRIYIYRTNACSQCTVHALCTTSPRGRYVYRWEHEVVLDRLKQRLATHPEIIKRRKKIIEHVFGTLKSIWDYGAFLLRGLRKVSAEAALMNLTYNIKRALTIIGTKNLMARLLKIVLAT